MAGKFELKKSKNDKYFFSLLAGNGQTILASEMYDTKASALAGIESVKKNAAPFHVGNHGNQCPLKFGDLVGKKSGVFCTINVCMSRFFLLYNECSKRCVALRLFVHRGTGVSYARRQTGKTKTRQKLPNLRSVKARKSASFQ